MTARLQLRRGTEAQWAASNPVLYPGEPGFATDTKVLKVGNGTDAWTALDAITGEPAGGPTALTGEDLPAGSVMYVTKVGSTWGPRPTARADVMVIWKGPDPSPAIVTSGTGGMRDGVDERHTT